jgi:hypothetical protein
MKNTEVKVSTDLKKFITKFEPNKFKMLARGIEIRGINDIHRSIELAKALIDSMNLTCCTPFCGNGSVPEF